MSTQPRAHRNRTDRSKPPAFLPVVGIGASAGGLEAFKEFLQHIPGDTGMAFVLVQHLDPAHESALTNLLTPATSMPVREVKDKLPVQPNHVYVIPPNAAMRLKNGRLRLLPRKQAHGAFRSIDAFFESLAEDRHDQAIGVILSGTASDGTIGLEAIKAECGITFAQDGSAKYDSMPRSAIAAGCVDFVLSAAGIARELGRIARHPLVKKPSHGPAHSGKSADPSQPDLAPGGDTSSLGKVLALLRNHSGVDFTLYKPATIERRIHRRMVLNKSESLAAYGRFLRGNAKELDALYSDLLINVTSFFRNPEAFTALKTKAFPRLLRPARDGPLRFWVPGCSTGQEAYSLAIAYLEFAEKNSRSPKLQIFATDLNKPLLEKARQGLYSKAQLHDVSPERLRQFFLEEQGGYRIAKNVRDLCVFAPHNILSDPPFSHMNLVSCRNLLIYIQPDLQHKIIPSFHYALNPGGLLFLGASESVGEFARLFESLDKKLRIFVRKPGPTPGLRLPISRTHLPARQENAPPLRPQGAAPELSAQREADRLSLARFAPPAVLIDADFQVLQFRGATGLFLQPPTGKATFDLLKVAREELVLPLRDALKKAVRLHQAVRTRKLRLNRGRTLRTLTIEVLPLKNLKEHCYLVSFLEPGNTGPATASADDPAAASSRSSGASAARRVAALERELAETRDYLLSLQDQYQAANEELQSSNEEITSANEELQSTNEELATSKEELESTNEELITVNEEMAHRNQDLNRLNSDLNNLHASINTPILLLGRDLVIRRFTPPAEKVFHLLASDIGRPLGGIRHNLACPDLEQLINKTIDRAVEQETEVRDNQGNWFVLRVHPYLCPDNKIDGAVLMLTNVNALKQNEQKIRESRDYANAIVDAVPPLLMLAPDLRVQTANHSFYEAFAVKPAQTEGRLVYELGNGQWDIPALRELLERILPKKQTIRDYEVTHDFETLGSRTMLLNACRVDHLHTIILSFVDITERKQAEALLRETKDALARHASDLDQAVQERTATLRETVRELEAFSYSMVHDMRAPLRSMNSFAQMLFEEYGSRLDDQARVWLRHIFNSAERLDQLIHDVLNYTHVLRDQAPLTPVNLGEFLNEMRASYSDWSPEAADIQIANPLPTVLGHKALLAQCFSNLVGNAIKFTAPGVRPRIRIWAERHDSMERIHVQDNGIGIEPHHHDRVFAMFQRLHPASAYEGTGIGLTIVRRAVERMGGLVDFYSTPGKGSTFWFDLPVAPHPVPSPSSVPPALGSEPHSQELPRR